MNTENSIAKDKNILFVFFQTEAEKTPEIADLIQNFCGIVVENPQTIDRQFQNKKIYICGNLENILLDFQPFMIIKELSFGYENWVGNGFKLLSIGQVPIIIADAGVFFRDFFVKKDYFAQISSAHQFQELTESSKPSKAFRKGIYITEVRQEISPANEEKLHFHLLRCSSNFSGATDNFRQPDREIITAINEAASAVFEQKTDLNHVLAQIYENSISADLKEKKAKIKAHSDKTKDMPANGLIAFCTFYDTTDFQSLTQSKTDKFNWEYKGISGFTRLHFKLKDAENNPNLAKEFTVILYPNSVFIIPLSTNRLYTHEIKPSMLNIDKIPTRMGYVVRCSDKKATFINGETFVKEGETWVKLSEMSDENMSNLKNSYQEENQTTHKIEYGKVDFSMNEGDYQKPIF